MFRCELPGGGAPRLVREGVLRQDERHADRFADIAVYATLAEDWERTCVVADEPPSSRAS
jgi:hypothetical protein